MTLSNIDVARRFGEDGATTGASLHMFIDGDTVYSYGHHFPIARRFHLGPAPCYLFNSNGYSATTAQHKGRVRCKLRGRVIRIPGCNPELAGVQALDVQNQILEATKKRDRAKLEHKKTFWSETILELQQQLDWLTMLDRQNKTEASK